ncbi:MAG TPA: DNA-directed RNA polymerase subunit omega [Pyrinomonadaceae bacterium]|jgi:DNA-directed RNA polymerase subunit K/omega
MAQSKQTTNYSGSLIAGDAQQTKTGSRYQLSIVAGLRSKQLGRGAIPRIEADLRRRRNTSIAIEEVRQGRITFKATAKVQANDGHASPLRDTFPRTNT